MSNKVYIGNLGDNVEEEELRTAFANYGEISEIVLKSGYGFILMSDSNDAEEAIKGLNDTEIGGRNVVVEKPRDRNNRGRGRGGGMGRGGAVGNCYNCGIPGHYQRDCRRPPQGGGGFAPQNGGHWGGPPPSYGGQGFMRGGGGGMGGGYGGRGMSRGRGRGGPGGGGGPRTCYNCNEPGHIARECPSGEGSYN